MTRESQDSILIAMKPAAPAVPLEASLCPACGYDLRSQIEQRAERCSECGLVLPDISSEPAETYRERYRHCLEAMRARFKKGWHDPPLKEREDMAALKARNIHEILLGLFLVVLVWSGIQPRDRFTWYLE